MSNEQKKSQQLGQLTYHQEKRNDNQAVDLKKRYTFSVMHQLERSQLVVGEAKLGERTLLIPQPLPENLQRHNGQPWISREDHFIHERSTLNCNGSTPNNDQQESEVRLVLDHQHKMEWKTLTTVESESWRALDKLHRQAILQLRSEGASWGRQIQVLREQLDDIQCLHRANQQKRLLLQQCQVIDKKLSTSGSINTSSRLLVTEGPT